MYGHILQRLLHNLLMKHKQLIMTNQSLLQMVLYKLA